MKNPSLLSILLLCIAFESCQKNQKNPEVTKAKDEKPINTECYKAIYESDTLDLRINTFKNGEINGNLVMKITDKPEKKGEISGKFHGDTLFVDYEFKEKTNDKVVFKNPMALLKKEGGLVLGSGKIETYLGRSYFAKGSPIEFENVKYKFTKVECNEK